MSATGRMSCGHRGPLLLRLSSVAAVGLAASVGCGDGSLPGEPSGITGTTSALTGTVVRVVDNTPIAGATIQIGERSTISATTGAFALSAPVGPALQVSVFASGYLRRDFTLTAGRAGLVVSLIPDSQPFSLGFYRQFVRNAYDSPLDLSVIQRWTVAPRFYVKTTVDETGALVPASIVDGIVTVVRRSVEELSVGLFYAAAIETGTAPRPLANGWLNVTFALDLGNRILGQATIGGNSGILRLRYDPDASDVSWGGAAGCVARVVSIAEHEITHTMGFHHTANEGEDFHSTTTARCAGAPRPEHVRYHAAVAYSRAPGNRDVDVDPLDRAGLAVVPSGRAPSLDTF